MRKIEHLMNNAKHKLKLFYILHESIFSTAKLIIRPSASSVHISIIIIIDIVSSN